MAIGNGKTTTFSGAVLATRERNYYDDSDFYAVVWDEEAQCIRSIEYATTRAWTYDCWASVDATPEVIEKANAWLYKWALGVVKDQMTREAEQAARTVGLGDTVKVVRGRKVPLGTQGTVIWMGEQSYNGSYPKKRIGLKDAEGTAHWTALSNVEKIAEVVLPTDEEIEEVARRVVAARAYHYPGAIGSNCVVV